MKRAKLFIALPTTAGRPNSSEGARRPRIRKRCSLPKRIPREQLDSQAAGGISPIDSTIIGQLRTALANTNDALLNACLQRKLLPLSIINSLNTARFLAITMLAARTAQTITGVPASILISEAWHFAPGILLDGLSKLDHENDFFGTGKSFSSIEASFLDHANRLSRNQKFQAVMLAKDAPNEYLKRVAKCRLWDELGRKDRAAMISVNDLKECDLEAHWTRCCMA